jgi:hypothetical protein
MGWFSGAIVFPSNEYSEALAEKSGVRNCTRKLLTSSEVVKSNEIAKKLCGLKIKIPWKKHLSPNQLLTTRKKISKAARANSNTKTLQSPPLVTPNGSERITLKLCLFEYQCALANLQVKHGSKEAAAETPISQNHDTSAVEPEEEYTNYEPLEMPADEEVLEELSYPRREWGSHQPQQLIAGINISLR